MKSSFTPGPWQVNGVRGSAVDVCDSNGVGICVPLRADGACEANADLIAAAPELLEALKLAADYIGCIPESAAGGDDEAIRIARASRAAIAKATGEQQ